MLSHKLPLHVEAPLTKTGTVGGFLRGSILCLRELRKRPETSGNDYNQLPSPTATCFSGETVPPVQITGYRVSGPSLYGSGSLHMGVSDIYPPGPF